MAWQYFGLNEMDCQSRYKLPANNGKYSFKYDQEVICSTQFSKTTPLENGEVFSQSYRNLIQLLINLISISNCIKNHHLILDAYIPVSGSTWFQ